MLFGCYLATEHQAHLFDCERVFTQLFDKPATEFNIITAKAKGAETLKPFLLYNWKN